ncbi:MAG: ThuA domain-containing protein [Candidatus Poribacteria bacterium]|nr:ThuA domain-containing protein [Candidatus Poribacteria bacterium]
METAPVTTAVVTGGHSYDVINFRRLFGGLDGIDAHVQHMDDFATSSDAERDSYDVVVFYHMLMDGPRNEGLPWYAGNPKAVLERLGETRQGIFILHHALLAYPQWSVWDEIVGLDDRSFGAHAGKSLHVEVADTTHPITRNLSDWNMLDETYTMAEPGAGNNILLTVKHPQSMEAIAWNREYKNSRVFCFQSGHDNQTWSDTGFKEILRRGILWCSRRL